MCSKDRWTTGDIIVLGSYELKAENIKKGVTIFGVTGTYDGFPDLTERNENDDIVVPLFENGKFVIGGVTGYKFYQEHQNRTGIYDRYTNSSQATWVAGLHPTITSEGITIFGAHAVTSSVYSIVGWYVCLKLPLISGKQMRLQADMKHSTVLFNAGYKVTVAHAFWGINPTTQWPSGNWQSGGMYSFKTLPVDWFPTKVFNETVWSTDYGISTGGL